MWSSADGYDPNDILAVIAEVYIEADNLPRAIASLDGLIARTDITGAQRARALLRRSFAKAESGDAFGARIDARALLKMRVLPDGYSEWAQKLIVDLGG